VAISLLVPRNSSERPPQPMVLPLDGAHEVVGAGVLASGENGKPELHIHAALGRAGRTIDWMLATRCIYLAGG